MALIRRHSALYFTKILHSLPACCHLAGPEVITAGTIEVLSYSRFQPGAFVPPRKYAKRLSGHVRFTKKYCIMINIYLIMRNGVFWDVTPCGSCKNNKLCISSRRASVASYGYVHSSPILVTLMKEAISSSETLFLQEPHDVTSQNTPFFIVTAMKTSNLTSI
jgi:hypothetical protein